tara:strand:+ start:1226 stop:1522 length:297 start_codon:yes stop_codon:yes gene_type:complete
MARVEIIGFAKFKAELEKSVLDIVKDVEDTVYATARANTPVLTGNAKRNWQRTKKTNKTGFTVENRVPYIERLDAGYSRKKPKGMTGPTLTQITRRTK